MNALLEAARQYSRRGWSVIPVNGKLASVKWKKFQTQQPTSAEIQSLFGRDGVTGLGVLLGEVSGWLHARDFDVLDSYTRWSEAHPDEAKVLPTSCTSRGRHVFFKHTADLKTVDLGDGELRGCGGYCLVPPSRHPDGHIYTWDVPLTKTIPAVDPVQVGLARSWLPCENAGAHTPPLCSLCDSVPSVDSVLSVHSVSVVQQLEKLASEFRATADHENHHLLFLMARGVRGLERDLARLLTPQETDLIFCRWYELSRSHLRHGQSKDEYRAEWLDALRSAKYPIGESEMIDIMRRAAGGPIPAEAHRYEDERFQRAVAVCVAAQRAVGDSVFYLSTRTLAALLGLEDHNRAAKILRVLEHDKLILTVEKGGPKTNRATRFKYTGKE